MMEIKEVKEGKEAKEVKENKIDWKRKLTSRKFWVAVIGFTTAVMVALHIDKMTVEQVTAIVSAMATLIAYIIGEGLTDAAHKEDK